MSKTILFVILMVILISILAYNLFKIYNIIKTNKMLEKYEIKCKSISVSDHSLGLLLDAKIICNKFPTLDEVLGTRNLIIENSFHSKPEDLIFVNIDWTNFTGLHSENSPKTLLCKTKQAYDILKNKFKNKNVIYTGFTSMDRFKTGYNIDYNKLIHICGKSPYKGTLKLVKTWLNHPEFPLLTIKVYDGVYEEIKKMMINKTTNNLEINTKFITDDEVDNLYNTYGVHLCPSNQEGWGHYIAEAKACKAVVLYTDAPCMNETFVDGYDGIAVRCNINAVNKINQICPFYEIEEEDMVNAVRRILNLSQDQKREIGENARKSFLENDIQFTKRFNEIIQN
jgi:glycosyltransferase involved in cell wall biosynthesis